MFSLIKKHLNIGSDLEQILNLHVVNRLKKNCLICFFTNLKQYFFTLGDPKRGGGQKQWKIALHN